METAILTQALLSDPWRSLMGSVQDRLLPILSLKVQRDNA